MASAAPKITLSRMFSQQLNSLREAFKFWKRDGLRKLERAHRVVGQRVKGEAQRRVPVKSNRLKQGILTTTYKEQGDFITEVGTNVVSDRGFPYPVVLEFGSKHIAGGAVEALGEDPNITDAEAIKDWPAKRQRGASNQQMPWLRPAWATVMPEAIELIDKAMEPPSQR